jgi:hypothetical protein
VQESELVYNIENRSRPRAGGYIQLGSVVTSIAAESVPLGRLCPDHGQTGNYSGPEVGFREIASDLRQARFWTTSVLPTTQELAVH